MDNSTKEIGFLQIDDQLIQKTKEAYFEWKRLDEYIRGISNRGLNMPDAISEPMGCFCLGLAWNRGSVPGDALDLTDNRIIEFKATSRFEGDLSSFGPECHFDDLVMLRFKLDEDLLYIYDLKINSSQLSLLRANSHQSVADQQKQGRRPHISLIDTFITPKKIEPILIFSIQNCRIIEDNR